MAHKRQDDTLVREYVRRARQDIADISAEQFQGRQPGYAFRYGPKPPRRKKISTFNIILFLFLSAVAIVLYIGNIIAVNGLVKEIDVLQREYDRIRNTNEILRAELNNRTGLEFIGSVAAERLELRNPNQPPQWITVKKSEVEALRRELQSLQK
jgi:cell division protein FtsB